MLLLFRHSAKAVQQNAHVSVKWPGVSVRLLNVTDLYHHLLGKQGGGGGVAATSAGQEDSKEERQKKCAESGGLKQNENLFASYCGIFSNFLHAAITTDLIPQWIMLHIIFRFFKSSEEKCVNRCNRWHSDAFCNSHWRHCIVLQVRFSTPSCSNTNKFCNAQFGSLIERPVLLCNEKSVENNWLHWTWVAQQFKKGVPCDDVCALFSGEVIW